jgi:uncharacterized protein YprB with RNaseH-like and TPR domain
MKPDLGSQLERLRRRVRHIENNPPRPAFEEELGVLSHGETNGAGEDDGQPVVVEAGDPDRPEHYDAEKVIDGTVLENQWGSYFVSERFYPGHYRHGSLDIAHLGELPGEMLRGISRDEIPAHDPSRWAFLDTETTGLAGGTGTCAFLVGVGTIEDGGFRVRLFFMRDYDEEGAMLAALADFLRWYDVLVTYNGKAYDVPLLETRYRLSRKGFPFERMHHLDLLHGARQLWKLRMESCRLMQLEYEILGVIREGDLPGELIPYYYFEYLRTRQAFRLVPLFHHNVIDIVSLACLTATVLPAFAEPTRAPLRHGADWLGLARWLKRSGEHDSALELYRRSLNAGLPDLEMFQALWESALLKKKRGRRDAMLGILAELTEVKNPHRCAAFEELAKHYEHREKDYAQALAMTESALRIEASDELRHRKGRLEKRLARQAKGRLLLDRERGRQAP